MVRLEYGSAVHHPILFLFLKYFSLLPATIVTKTAFPMNEAATVYIGHPALTVPAFTVSVSAAAISVWVPDIALVAALSVASKSNKSLRAAIKYPALQ